MSEPNPPDRLRALLDAVLADESTDLPSMARDAHASPFHFARQVSRGSREAPMSMRRRVSLERAAWRLRAGGSVTDAAWEAGYDSVEGFARAYARAWGHPPSATPHDPGSPTAHWLPAPNGIHFHAPQSLWVAAEPGASPGAGGVTSVLVHHDLVDLARLLDAARALPDEAWRRRRLPGFLLLHWAGPEESIAALLGRAVGQLEVWLASIDGTEHPQGGPDEEDLDPADRLAARLAAVSPRWLAMVRDVEVRDAWGDRLVDALCDPPESFVLGSVLAHVLTYSAARRGVVRGLLRADGLTLDDGDPIMWLREQ